MLQSVVDARREGNGTRLSGSVVETIELLGISTYRYQIMDRPRHTIQNYLIDEKIS